MEKEEENGDDGKGVCEEDRFLNLWRWISTAKEEEVINKWYGVKYESAGLGRKKEENYLLEKPHGNSKM